MLKKLKGDIILAGTVYSHFVRILLPSMDAAWRWRRGTIRGVRARVAQTYKDRPSISYIYVKLTERNERQNAGKSFFVCAGRMRNGLDRVLNFLHRLSVLLFYLIWRKRENITFQLKNRLYCLLKNMRESMGYIKYVFKLTFYL